MLHEFIFYVFTTEIKMNINQAIKFKQRIELPRNTIGYVEVDELFGEVLSREKKIIFE